MKPTLPVVPAQISTKVIQMARKVVQMPVQLNTMPRVSGVPLRVGRAA